MLTLEQLKKTHTTYGGNARTWDYLARSYAGGNQYREAGYLRKYIGEDAGPGNQYAQRLISTALDNHVQNVVSIYRSYIFKNEPMRKLGDAMDMYGVEEFMDDCDLDGSDLDDFMRLVGDTLSVYGSAWIAVDRPSYQAATLAEEQALGIRPYVTLFTPLQVLDWKYERALNGRYELVYVKIREASYDDHDVIRVWTPSLIQEYKVSKTQKPRFISTGNGINNQPVQEEIYVEYDSIIEATEFVNPLGVVPVVCAYNQRKVQTGLGLSDCIDVADQQRMIYNLCSELEQNIRISSHPSLVKPLEVDASAGAGAVINLPDNMDSNLKPYLLQPTSATVDSILAAINYHVNAIDQMTNLSSVRGTKTASSGVALEAEFLLLNTRLADKAANLEKIEYKIWDLWFQWQDMEMPEDFDIEYEDSFSIRDSQRDMDMIIKGLTAIDNPEYQKAAKKQIVALTLEEDDIEEVQNAIDQQYENFQEPMMEMPPASLAQAQAELNSEEMIDGCPLPMVDKQLNIANHKICVEEANLGPASVTNPGVYWIQRADRLGITEAQSREQTCANCAYYMNTQQIKDCWNKNEALGNIPLATEVDPSWENVPNPSGFCLKYDITCTPTRTCDAWAPGGPIID